MEEENIAIRLKRFMDHEGLTNSQFADWCKIPRPSLSQIMTGRNKKISDVMVGQIHSAFPRLSVLWLMFGEGPMLNDTDAGADEDSVSEIFQDNHRDESEYGKENGLNAPENSERSRVNTQNFANSARSFEPVQIAKSGRETRKISHITVYYDDSTFETFFPR